MTEPKMQDLHSAQQGVRLPCRGCQVSCPNYQQCDGKPWRITAEIAVAVMND